MNYFSNYSSLKSLVQSNDKINWCACENRKILDGYSAWDCLTDTKNMRTLNITGSHAAKVSLFSKDYGYANTNTNTNITCTKITNGGNLR